MRNRPIILSVLAAWIFGFYCRSVLTTSECGHGKSVDCLDKQPMFTHEHSTIPDASPPSERVDRQHDDCGDSQLVYSPEHSMRLFVDSNVEESDKVTLHKYHLMYGPSLSPFLLKEVRLLEIGVHNGLSLKLWERLFPHHQLIAGIGYGSGKEVHETFKRFTNEKHILYTGSQADGSFLTRVLEDLKGKKFDIIIDDGSHVPWHQIFSLEFLFDKFLSEGGVYIIEDIETSYWDATTASLYGYPIVNSGIGKRGSAIEKLKGLVDVINRKFLLDPSFSILHGNVDHLISHLTFSQNCVVLHKQTKQNWEEVDMKYRVSESKVDYTRAHYNEYKARSNWEVAGMVRE